MHRKSKTTQIVKLTTATSLDEAIKILTDRKAGGIYKKHISLAFNLAKDPDNKLRLQMLSETENDLAAEEKKKMDEMIVTEESTEGNARVTGKTGQADGRETGDVNPPGEGSHEGSEPAQTQTGTSQLESALEEAVGDDHEAPVDPMNKAIIDYMDDGMSQVEAHNAAGKDKELSEAVFMHMFKKHIVPLFSATGKDMKTLKETIKLTDGKVEISRKPEGALNESINDQQNGWPQGNGQQQSSGEKYDSNRKRVAEKSTEILKKYLED